MLKLAPRGVAVIVWLGWFTLFPEPMAKNNANKCLLIIDNGDADLFYKNSTHDHLFFSRQPGSSGPGASSGAAIGARTDVR